MDLRRLFEGLTHILESNTVLSSIKRSQCVNVQYVERGLHSSSPVYCGNMCATSGVRNDAKTSG